MALASPDYEFMLLDMAIDQPPADRLVQQLRQDGRTATLPVGLIAREGQFSGRTAPSVAAAIRCARPSPARTMPPG